MVFDLFFYCVTVKTIYSLAHAKLEVKAVKNTEEDGSEKIRRERKFTRKNGQKNTSSKLGTLVSQSTVGKSLF